MRAVVALAAVVLITLAASACGDDEEPAASGSTGPSAPATLDGRQFIVTAVEGHELVDGSTVRFTFDAGTVGINAGCNSMSGDYELRADELVVEQMATTEMACERELMEQDRWLADFVSAGPSVAATGPTTLTLTGDGATITLTDREVVEPDVPLDGTTWTLDGIITGDAVSSVPGGAVATIRIDGGTMSVDTSCNTGSTSVDVRETTIFLGPLALTKKACGPDATEVERALVAILMGELAYEIDANRLTLSGAQNGLTFVADPGA